MKYEVKFNYECSCGEKGSITQGIKEDIVIDLPTGKCICGKEFKFVSKDIFSLIKVNSENVIESTEKVIL